MDKQQTIKAHFGAGQWSGSSAKITASLEFTKTGYLRAVYLNCQSDGDQETLEHALNRLFRPDHAGGIKRLMRWGR